jgi:hypothetical protein
MIMNHHYITGAILYSLALNFKQMCFYYSLGFLFFVVVHVIRDSGDVYQSFVTRVCETGVLYCR